MRIDPPRTGLRSICEPLLASVPHWFGIEDANSDYLRFVDEHPTSIVWTDDHEPVGFLGLNRHFPGQSAELHIIVVRPDHHRHGVGRALLEAAEAELRAEGVRFLQVKTLGPSDPDDGYAKTRAFYVGMGFTPLEELLELWPGNPALIMVKALSPTPPTAGRPAG